MPGNKEIRMALARRRLRLASKFLRTLVLPLVLAALCLSSPSARPIDHSYVFPSVEFGPGWVTELWAVNPGSQPALVRLSCLSGGMAPGSTSLEQTIPPGGRHIFTKA